MDGILWWVFFQNPTDCRWLNFNWVEYISSELWEKRKHQQPTISAIACNERNLSLNRNERLNGTENSLHWTLWIKGINSLHAIGVSLPTNAHHRIWTLYQWKNVAWSNVSRFLLKGASGHIRRCCYVRMKKCTIMYGCKATRRWKWFADLCNILLRNTATWHSCTIKTL